MYPPKRFHFKKHQKGKTNKVASNKSLLCFGKYGIRATENTRLKASTIEAVRRVITRRLKRNGQIWVRLHPSLSVSAKAKQVRMGKGKGSLSYWACRVKRGQILYEMDGVASRLAEQAYSIADSKLPIKTVFVTL